jgi:hypothetical protein
MTACGGASVCKPLTDLGQEVFPREHQTPDCLGALVKSDADRWLPIIKEFKIKAE